MKLLHTGFFSDADLDYYTALDGNSNDSKGSNNGTDANISYATANGRYGQGAAFNGSTSTITLPSAAEFKPTSAFSVGAWIKTSNTSGDMQIFQSHSLNPEFSGFLLSATIAGTARLRFATGKNTGPTNGVDFKDVIGTTTLSDDIFHFCVGVWTGTTLLTYVDGVQDGSESWSNAPVYAATTYQRIGVRVNVGTNLNYFNGSIDEVFLFSRELTAGEIRQLYIDSSGGGIAAFL